MKDQSQLIVEARLLIPVDGQTWMLNYPAFKKASSKPVIPSKPAVSTLAPSAAQL
jgi:hypothetical protein